ncbi:MAG: IS3 family transposase [Lachnospiraceae bacterium]|nr:IS3 family transposase [Lachnospiraceae bacterium]
MHYYIRWYSTGRIKMSLGAMSPMEYRRSIGLIS